MGTRGGKRAGSGNKKGVKLGPNRLTRARQAAVAKMMARNELSAERVLEEQRRIAFFDIRQLFDTAGNLKPIHTLDAETAAVVASLEVIIKNAAAGDGHTDTVHKLKVWDKPKVLEQLAKHFGLLTDRLEHSGSLTIIHELPE